MATMMVKDPHESRTKDELITNSSVLIHIYDRCDEVRGKVDRKILYQGKKETDRKSTRLNSSHYGLSRMPSSA